MHGPTWLSGRRLTLGVVALGVLALLALVALWPRGDAPDLGAQPGRYVDATVRAVDPATCLSTEVLAQERCVDVTVALTSGPDEGGEGVVVVRETDFDVPELAVGDEIVVFDVPGSPPPYRYVFADFQRATPLVWLAGAFVGVVLLFGRAKGARALAGLAASVLLIVVFVVPALLRDEPPVLVALAATTAIAFVALYLAHGVHLGTTVALAGTMVSLVVTMVLALVMVSAMHLSGLSDEQAQVLRVTADALDLRGLLVAAIVIGALGVLDDVTVTQVSTVAALRRADPTLSNRRLYLEATAVGRDHVASTVNTLVLAYAGAALPLVLLFAQGNIPITRILTSEVVAVELVRMLVGSIGLVLSVPITTALAAVVLSPTDARRMGGHHHAPAERAAPLERPPARWEDFGPQ